MPQESVDKELPDQLITQPQHENDADSNMDSNDESQVRGMHDNTERESNEERLDYLITQPQHETDVESNDDSGVNPMNDTVMKQQNEDDPPKWLITQPQHESCSDSEESCEALPNEKEHTPKEAKTWRQPSPLFSTLYSAPIQKPRCIDNEGNHFAETIDDSDSDSDSMTYEGRRDERVKRNQARLVSLGLAVNPDTLEPEKVAEDSSTCIKKHFGMIMPTKYNGLHDEHPPKKETSIGHDPVQHLEERVEAIRQQYPGRESQIFSLVSLLQTAIDQTIRHETLDEVFVPPPLFVQGAVGTAKTSIVRDVVDVFTELHSNRKRTDQIPIVGSAYINCATISPSSIFTLVEDAFAQIVKGVEEPTHTRRTQISRKRKLKLILREPAEKVEPNGSIADPESRSSTLKETDDFNDSMAEEMEERIEHNRLSMSQTIGDDPGDIIATQVIGPRRQSREANGREGAFSRSWTTSAKTHVQDYGCGDSSVRPYDAPIAFGRSLRRFCGGSLVARGTKGNACAILIIDQAEKLMTLTPKRTTARLHSNYLAQLLLLPKELNLNLMVICISTHSLLLHSRSNSAVPASKSESVGTVEHAIHPLTIRFPAYSDKKVFKDILKERLPLQQSNEASWLGLDESKTDSIHQISLPFVVNSFLDTVIQSLLGTTRDVRDMLRMARDLWPKYIIPIENRNIEATTTTVLQRLKVRFVDVDTQSRDLLQNELLQYLDEKIIRHTALWINNCFGLMNEETQPKSEMTYVTKCILLAGFICQHNKAEKDRNLFTNQKSGKKSKKNTSRTGEGNEDNAAFADTTWDQQRLKMLRPRAFALERMLSVFVNIVGMIQTGDNLIHPEIDGNDSNLGQIIRCMGTPVFFESLTQLREMGLLREIPGNRWVGGENNMALNGMDISSPMYCCDLGDEYAKAIAKSIKLPLSDFLIK